MAGNYTFQVTITDAAGLSVTSSVNVTVSQTLTSIVVSPGTATVGVRKPNSALSGLQTGVLSPLHVTCRHNELPT